MHASTPELQTIYWLITGLFYLGCYLDGCRFLGHLPQTEGPMGNQLLLPDHGLRLAPPSNQGGLLKDHETCRQNKSKAKSNYSMLRCTTPTSLIDLNYSIQSEVTTVQQPVVQPEDQQAPSGRPKGFPPARAGTGRTSAPGSTSWCTRHPCPQTCGTRPQQHRWLKQGLK